MGGVTGTFSGTTSTVIGSVKTSIQVSSKVLLGNSGGSKTYYTPAGTVVGVETELKRITNVGNYNESTKVNGPSGQRYFCSFNKTELYYPTGSDDAIVAFSDTASSVRVYIYSNRVVVTIVEANDEDYYPIEHYIESLKIYYV